MLRGARWDKTKILIADDDQNIRDSVKAILESKQYDVVTAADRIEGMKKTSVRL